MADGLNSSIIYKWLTAKVYAHAKPHIYNWKIINFKRIDRFSWNRKNNIKKKKKWWTSKQQNFASQRNENVQTQEIEIM